MKQVKIFNEFTHSCREKIAKVYNEIIDIRILYENIVGPVLYFHVYFLKL